MLKAVIYVQMYANRFVVRKLGGDAAIDRTATEPFSHPRTVIGSFTSAEAFLKGLITEAKGGFVLRVDILIHAMERVEGGLTQIEERALVEMAMGAGATTARTWTGAVLSDQEIVEKFKGPPT